MLTIDEPKHPRFALLQLGFRPFFLLAAIYAVLSMVLWGLHLQLGDDFLIHSALPTVSWHAHEMIYGYAVAVVAGFLLTSVRNWTNIQTLHGIPLLLLASCWIMARLLSLMVFPCAIILMALFDLLFACTLCIAILLPLIKAKQWAQLGIWVALCLLMLSNMLFYFGALGWLADGMRWGIYSGLYLLILLVLLMGRRVIPFFIEKGIEKSVTLTNRPWIDRSSLWLMLAFWVVEVFLDRPNISGSLAAALFAVHFIRLIGWYHSAIWHKPLLWVLYIGYAWIVTGFLFNVLSVLGVLDAMLAIHAFGYGGVAMISIGMMVRVALGHTGRNVFDPPRMVRWIFILLLVGGVSRVVLPALWVSHYAALMLAAQGFWIVAFAIFIWHFAPMLLMPRVDGRYG